MVQTEEQLSAQILIVEDEPAHAEAMAETLRKRGHVCTIVHDLSSAEEELQHGTFDLVVTDLVMGTEDAGLKVLEATKKTQPNAETIVVTAYGDIPTTKTALRNGAYDFIEKPLDFEFFRNTVHRAAETVLLQNQNRELRQQVEDRFGLEGIVGTSPAIQRVLNTIRQVAGSDIPVVVSGESGTGKELVARAVHENSPRGKRPFKPLNCAGLSEAILESELFGHVRGAFTGAERDRQGVFEYADGGTIFLDEIGDMPMSMQAKLLRVLESGEVVRVGANDACHVNVRMLSATNQDLQALIKEHRFRDDLYFRIRGVEIHLPPLRERREDINELARHFVEEFANKMDKSITRIDDATQMALMQYDWPGNVRQLRNVIQSMMVVCSGDALTEEDLPPEIRQAVGGTSHTESMGSLAGKSLEEIEKQAIRNTLRLTNGNREQAAQMLGIGERTLYRKLREYGLK